MTPAARLSAAADILDALEFDRLVAPQLKAWARAHRFAGSKDRRAIADRVYTCLRRRRSSAAQGGDMSGRALVLGSLIAEDDLSSDAVAALCTGGYAPDPLTPAERTALGAPPVYGTDGARLDWPDWLLPETDAAFGAARDRELDALRQRAPLDLRVNALKVTRAEAIAALAEAGIDAASLPICETALRLPPSTPILTTEAFERGMVEPQDAASQMAALHARAEPGQTVLDFCAGAGGKTMALAAAMQNRGTLFAHDTDARRMDDLPDRAKRCGATIIRRVETNALEPESSDTVLVDAPCSGSGSWRRDPLGKWRLTPERLTELHTAQRQALATAARFVKPGGALTYVTCSVLPTENSAQVAWFADERPDFTLEETLDLWPARDDVDGFFAARFRRRHG